MRNDKNATKAAAIRLNKAARPISSGDSERRSTIIIPLNLAGTYQFDTTFP
jgi:hypothetical protein